MLGVRSAPFWPYLATQRVAQQLVPNADGLCFSSPLIAYSPSRVSFPTYATSCRCPTTAPRTSTLTAFESGQATASASAGTSSALIKHLGRWHRSTYVPALHHAQYRYPCPCYQESGSASAMRLGTLTRHHPKLTHSPTTILLSLFTPAFSLSLSLFYSATHVPVFSLFFPPGGLTPSFFPLTHEGHHGSELTITLASGNFLVILCCSSRQPVHTYWSRRTILVCCTSADTGQPFAY